MSTAKREYVYDHHGVKFVKCLVCEQPIGDEEYVENQIMARFGRMFFTHKRCENHEEQERQKEEQQERAFEMLQQHYGHCRQCYDAETAYCPEGEELMKQAGLWEAYCNEQKSSI